MSRNGDDAGKPNPAQEALNAFYARCRALAAQVRGGRRRYALAAVQSRLDRDDFGDYRAEKLEPAVRPTLRTGLIAIGVFVAFFVAWGFAAPMNSAAIAPGLLRAEGGGRKVVQHLEGGIVEALLVKEGDRVKAGQALIRLDRTQSGAVDASTQAQYDALLAQDARLTAEAVRSGAVSYPAELAERTGDPKVKELIDGQNAVFSARRQSQSAQRSILAQRIGQANAEIGSYVAQLNALESQQRLLQAELANVEVLVAEGLERQTRLLTLQRQASAADGQRGQLQGSIARVRQSIAETRAQLAYLDESFLSDVTAQQREVRTKLAEYGERLKSSRDVNRRREILAPVDGTVVNLRVVTQGGVVRPGEPILDLVPADAPIVVLARVKANDVDAVAPGQSASVRLTPYKARVLPMLDGKVRKVSADVNADERTGLMYYEAEIELDAAELAKLDDVTLISGMPAEVFIDLGERSLFQYFLQPLTDSFRRAFREP